MLRPRDGHDLRVLSSQLDISPKPSSLRWIHDVFGNSVAIADFDAWSDRLVFDSTITVEHYPLDNVVLAPGDDAYYYPFAYDPGGTAGSDAVDDAAIQRSGRRARGVGAAVPERRRPDQDARSAGGDDPRRAAGISLSQAPRARHATSARYIEHRFGHLPGFRAVHDRGAAAGSASRRVSSAVTSSFPATRPTVMSAAVRPPPGCGPICRARAGSSSIPPTASSATAISFASPWRASRARPSRFTAPMSDPADAFLRMDVTIHVVSVGEEAKVQAAC